VLAVDTGTITNGSAGQWLSGTMLGAVSECYRRSVKERTHEAQVRAVERGLLPFPNVPPGYQRGEDGVLAPNGDAPVVVKAFKMRANGATIKDVHAYLAEHGGDLADA
jgi:DNA invertase Pin-like site-specific DNA recombinase